MRHRAFAGVLEEMRSRLDAWMRETKDPLLEGPVPAPSGAELNLPDQLSANDPTATVAPATGGGSGAVDAQRLAVKIGGRSGRL